MKRVLLVTSLAAVLSACEGIDERDREFCLSGGLEPDTQEFEDCVAHQGMKCLEREEAVRRAFGGRLPESVGNYRVPLPIPQGQVR